MEQPHVGSAMLAPELLIPLAVFACLEIVSMAQRRITPRWSAGLWDELYAATAGKDIAFE